MIGLLKEIVTVSTESGEKGVVHNVCYALSNITASDGGNPLIQAVVDSRICQILIHHIDGSVFLPCIYILVSCPVLSLYVFLCDSFTLNESLVCARRISIVLGICGVCVCMCLCVWREKEMCTFYTLNYSNFV